MTEQELSNGTDLRTRAVRQLKKRRDFHGHLLVYVLVNGVLVVIWAVTNPHVFFWPLFLIAIWGIGVVMNAWDVYVTEDFDEARIRSEMERLEKRR